VRGNRRNDDRRNVGEKLRSSSRGRLWRGKGKSGLIKNNMAKNEDTLSGKVHAAITLMMRRITKKNTSTRSGREFIRHSGGGVGVAKTTKNAKRQVAGVRVMKSKVWGGCTNIFGGEAIKNVSGVMKSFNPKTRR
jgi:hypothetical protein